MNTKWTDKITNEELWRINQQKPIENQIKKMELDWTHISVVTFMYTYCYVCSVYSVSLRCSVYCLYVNVHCSAATRCQPNCS